MEPAASFVTRSPAPFASVRAARADGHDLDVSFVFVTFGTGHIVVQAIDRLTRSLSEADHSYEVIVVDNPHHRAHRRSRMELAVSTAGVRVLTASHNLGFGGGCELGALHSRGRMLAFVNPDLMVGAGWLEPMIRYIGDGASIVAPVLTNPDGSVQEAGARLHADGSTTPILDTASVADGSIVPDYASAACWLMTRDEHERSGGFDPAFFPAYYEDVDLALRIREAGGRVRIATDVRVEHRRGAGTLDGSAGVETTDQRRLVVERHPEITWTQPGAFPTARW
jgi:GT2 family glycosyltransferase